MSRVIEYCILEQSMVNLWKIRPRSIIDHEHLYKKLFCRNGPDIQNIDCMRPNI